LPRPPSDSIAALLAWIDGIGETGLDGHDLRELGLKNGSLTVDDARTGKRWTFQDISLSLERPRGGGVVVTVGSDNPEGPWGLTASIKPIRDGYRSIELEARQVSANNLLLASRLGDGSLQINLPLSASLRGEIGPNGIPQSLVGRIVAEAGFVSDTNDADSRIDIDRAEFKINWDAASRVLAVPFQILSGGNRLTLLGQVEAPAEAPGPWAYSIGGGTVVLNSPGATSDPLILNRIAWAVRSGQAAFCSRSRRSRQCRSGRGDVRHRGLLERRLASRRGTGGHAYVGRCHEAAVAGLHRPQSARLVHRSSDERQRGAGRDRGECAAQYPQSFRSAGPG
jgi:hypothetical protein